MKSIIVVLLTVILMISLGKEMPSAESSDDLFVMFEENKAADADEGSGAGATDDETAIIQDDSTDEEERLFHKFPLHVFMKKKHPFVTHSTMTRTSTITALITSSTVGLCAQLVNVTGPCRLRKGLWVDDPIVLSFDDEMDSIDDSLSPTRTSRMETTAMPMAQVSTEQKKDNRRISVRSGSLIHSSKEEEELREDNDEGRFGFFGLKKKFKKKVKLITVVTTTLVTVTSTSTYYKTVSTKSFFIQICTPSPFPFDVCSGGRKRREIEIDHENVSPPTIKSREITDTML